MYVKYIWLDLKYIALDLHRSGKLLNLAFFSSLKLLFCAVSNRKLPTE